MANPAEQLFNEAVEAARHGDWEQARAGFAAAQSLSARPVILINLAGAQARTGRLVDAARNYRAVADDTSSDAAPFRAAASGMLKTLQPRIPRVHVRTAGLAEGDVVRLDGVPLSRDALAAPVLVDPGAHTITVTRDGNDRARVADHAGRTGNPRPVAAGALAPPPAPRRRPRARCVPLRVEPNGQGRGADTPIVVGLALALDRGRCRRRGRRNDRRAAQLARTRAGFSGSVSPGIIHVQ